MLLTVFIQTILFGKNQGIQRYCHQACRRAFDPSTC